MSALGMRGGHCSIMPKLTAFGQIITMLPASCRAYLRPDLPGHSEMCGLPPETYSHDLSRVCLEISAEGNRKGRASPFVVCLKFLSHTVGCH